MSSNIFFKKKNIRLDKIFPKTKFRDNFIVKSIQPLHTAGNKDITFFDSIKYKKNINNSKNCVCITSEFGYINFVTRANSNKTFLTTIMI